MPTRSRPASDQALLLAALGGTGPRGKSRGAGAPTLEAGRRLFYWLPVAVALGLFAQVALLGLKPALRESTRLGGAEAALLERYQAEQSRRAELERVHRALRDPIYLERERRLLEDPQGGLLRR